MTAQFLGDKLEALYAQYNRAVYISPDPLEYVLRYPDPADRELVGLLASSLAFGNVRQIGRSIECVLSRMPNPHAFLRNATRRTLNHRFSGFRHRYVGDAELVELLLGAKRVMEEWGSLGELVAVATPETSVTIMPGVQRLVDALTHLSRLPKNYLLPSPAHGSACKRLHLYMRWMVRSDDVDPGGWNSSLRAKLVIPLDTHMHRTALALGLTQRKAADQATALEITAAFRRWAPDDPVRYDFALTRLGIRTDTDLAAFLRSCTEAA